VGKKGGGGTKKRGRRGGRNSESKEFKKKTGDKCGSVFQKGINGVNNLSSGVGRRGPKRRKKQNSKKKSKGGKGPKFWGRGDHWREVLLYKIGGRTVLLT